MKKRQRNGQTNGQTNKQADKSYKDGHTDRQPNRKCKMIGQTNRQIDSHIVSNLKNHESMHWDRQNIANDRGMDR